MKIPAVGTKAKPRELMTPPGTASYTMHKDGTVEAWGRSPRNPIGGWYGLKKGLRGRFGMYVPPLLEALGLVELTHEARGNRVRAI